MKNLLFLTAVLALLFAASANALEPGDTLWTRTYGGVDHDQPYSAQQTTDGGYIIAGYTGIYPDYDVYLVKTDADGDTLWTRTHGGSDYDKAFAVQQTTDGGYIVAGETWSFGGRDVYLLKTDADGDTLWTRTYGGSGWDGAYYTQQTTDGGYIMSGFFESTAGCWDIYVVKTAANGDSLWTRTYGQSKMNEGYCVRQTTDGGYMVAGYTGNWGGEDLYLVKIDANGDTLWTRTHGGRESDWAESVRQTTDGGYIVAGSTNSFGAGDYDFYLLKIDSLGDTLWTRTYGGSSGDYGFSVQQTTDGGYIVAGGTFSFGAGQIDCYLLRTDPNGDTLWTHTYGGSTDDQAYSVQQTTDGGYIVSARTNSFGAGAFDVWLLKVAGEAHMPHVTIEIIPDDPPVTVPQGGSFGFTGTLTNNTEDPQTIDVWVMASGPEKGIYGPFKEFHGIPLAPSQSRSRHLSQGVPNLAPLGFYDYIAYCGDYPSTVTDSSYFQIEVVEGVGSSQGGWVLTGSFLEGDLADLPSEFALLSNYPNPFNATTVIEYELPEPSSVKLEVYNLLGEKVATLVNGAEEAGYRSVSWDASEVSSGLYFYKLTAGDFSETKRMILVK